MIDANYTPDNGDRDQKKISNFINKINNWAHDRKPFLFIIDFEMKEPKAYLLNALPEDVCFSMPKNQAHHVPLGTWNDPIMHIKKAIPVSHYSKAFQYVNHQILFGNSYLLNLSFPTEIDTKISLKEIYKLAHAKYKLYYKNRFIVFSPETFIQIKNGMIYTFPMKGTINADIKNAHQQILHSQKELAEHCTIVDLLRNDLSMVSNNVKVERFRYIEKINTQRGSLLQVSSEIKGHLPKDYLSKLGTILCRLLPAGSISGAPKKKTLDIIKKAEKISRGYYTGVFGIFDGRELDSAVMIRFIENTNNKLFYRSGGGITHMSKCESEYNELMDKIYVPTCREH